MRPAPILIALAIATTARADDRTLHLLVHGSIDSAALGTAIAKELDVDVEVVEGRCDVPCLHISVDGKNTATVLFAPRSGPPRQRALKLGSSTTQWPMVLTLLVGNVVRDEARDVLANLPSRELPAPGPEAPVGEVPAAPEASEAEMPAEAAEAPEAIEAPIALPGAGPVASGPTALAPADPDGPREHRWLGLGFVPVLSTDLTHVGTVRHSLSIDLLVGVSGGSSGLAVAGIADIERGFVSGVQVAGVVSIARRVAGTQVAGIAAVAGDLDGVQIAGTAAIAGKVAGFQVAGIASLSRSDAEYQIGGVAAVARGSVGTQVAGIASVASREAALQIGGVNASAGRGAGVQIAGVSTIAGGNANVQIGGVANVARGTVNVQIGGVVNVAQRVRGVQIATVNVAREVDGVQVGVVNVGGSRDGFSFGLINIVPGGRVDLESAIDSSKTGSVLFRHGGRRWHNVYGIGGHPVTTSGSRDDVWMYGLGFGPSFELDNTVVDLEAISWQVNHGPRHESDVSLLAQGRLSIAHRIAGPLAIVVGGIFNTYITSDQQSPLILERRSTGSRMQTGVTVTTWPSAFVGLRI